MEKSLTNKEWYNKVYRQGEGAIVNCKWSTGIGLSQKEELENAEDAFSSIVADYRCGMEAVNEGFDNVPVGAIFAAVAYLIASAYGCPMKIYNNLTITRPRYHKMKELALFEYIPEAYKYGYYQRIFENIEKMNECYPEIPLTVSDNQSPIDIITELLPMEEAILLMYDEPELAHKVLSALTNSIIDVNRHFERKIKNFAGFASSTYLPFGIHLSDDNAAFLSPDIYREFATPYAEKLASEFGGISFHVCMKFEQNLKNLSSVKGFMGFDAMPYYNDPVKIIEALGSNKVWQVYDYSFSRPMGEDETSEAFYKRLIDINDNSNAMKFDIFRNDKEAALRLAEAVKNYAAKKSMQVR